MLPAAWSGYDLESRLRDAFGKPVLVMNDADVQACAAVEGKGSSWSSRLAPEWEPPSSPTARCSPWSCPTSLGREGQLRHLLGNAERKKVGNAKWSKS